ncbi:hypothetical protein BBJ28_00007030 [Nothophytophthora sp. Chile5]|nr:hypothetical protein BBJ28_00007030 [Nothophytophthora sp. Chile5]
MPVASRRRSTVREPDHHCKVKGPLFPPIPVSHALHPCSYRYAHLNAAYPCISALVFRSGDDIASQRVTRLEAEKLGLIEKLRKAMTMCRAMQKQLEDVKAENARLQVTDDSERVAKLEQELALKEEEKLEIVAKLQDVIARYHALQQELEGVAGERQVAFSQVEAFKLELRTQQELAAHIQEKDAETMSELNEELQQAARRFAQEEARVLVFQEENNRLTHQVTAMLADKQQQEREMQQLVAESDALHTKVADLSQQVSGARQQQEDTEQLYLEVASKLNHTLRENDELKHAALENPGKSATANDDQIRELEARIDVLTTELTAETAKWEQKLQQSTQQLETLTTANDKAQTELKQLAEIREQLLINVGIDLTYESIESMLDTKSREISMLTEQLAAVEGPQEEAICEAVGAAVSEAERLRSQLDSLQAQYEALTVTKTTGEGTVQELRVQLERLAEEHAASLAAQEEGHRQVCQGLEEKQTQLSAELEASRARNQQNDDRFAVIKRQMDGMNGALETSAAASTENGAGTVSDELELALGRLQEHLKDSKEAEAEVQKLKDRVQTYETEKLELLEKLTECETALQLRVNEIEALTRLVEADANREQQVSAQELTAPTVQNGDEAVNPELEAATARLHAVEAEMSACKAENLRMIFEVAKTADGALKLKQDHEALLEAHQEKMSELEGVSSQLEALVAANRTLETQLARKSEELRSHLEAFAMQREDSRSLIAGLRDAMSKAQKEKSKVQRDLEDIKNENDVLEERISELHAIAESKTEPDEWQEKDREVEELRSSLVQAKVNFLEQKQQLTALEKKLVEVSQKSGGSTATSPSLEAERREFEAALIEMIDMEKKLQVAYEAKQGLESTLQERQEAKTELEDRLSTAEDRLAELEQQLEQKVALIATIEEQLRLAEEERENLADAVAKTKSKLERSEGRLQEKAIEFEAFKTTTNMLKDERSRLFNEIALLQEQIVTSEEQKAALASSQTLANEELEEQLNELADKIAELETEKQELREKLEDTMYRSEEDIHELRERLYVTEEGKSTLDEENLRLEAAIEALEAKVAVFQEQQTALEEATSKMKEQLEQTAAEGEAFQAQVTLLTAEKEESSARLATLEEQMRVEKVESEAAAAKLEAQVADNEALEGKTASLKQMAEKALQSLQSTRDELLALTEERDAAKTHLSEKTAAFEALETQFEGLKQQILTLEDDAASLQRRRAEEERSAVETLQGLKDSQAQTVDSLEAARRELAEAEACVMVLVEERDAARKELSAKELKIEMLTSQQGELELTTQKLESAMQILRSKSAAEAEGSAETIRKLTESTTEAEKTAQSSKESAIQAENSLQVARKQLTDSESRVAALEEERDSTRTSLNEQETKQESLDALQGDLQLKLRGLERELEELRSQNAAELQAANEATQSAKEAESTAAETLNAVRRELTEAESCVMVLVEERDAAKKALSGKELKLEVLGSEHGELQLKSQTIAAELETLRSRSLAEAQEAEESIQRLKESLDLVRRELLEVKERGAVITTDYETTSSALRALEEEHKAQIAQTEELGQMVVLLKTELEDSRSLHATALQTAEETICSLKDSDLTTKTSLESVRQELSEAESRMASLMEEHEAAKEQGRSHEALSAQQQEQLRKVESELEELRGQHSTEAQAAEETIHELKQVETQTAEALGSVQQELVEAEARATSAMEERDVVAKDLTKTETKYETLRSQHEDLQQQIQALERGLEELQALRSTEAEAAEESIHQLKESQSQAAESLEMSRRELSEAELRATSLLEEREAAVKTWSEKEATHEALSAHHESLQERIEALENEQKQHLTETQLAEETIRSLKDSETRATEALEAVRRELSEAEARVVAAVEERVSIQAGLAEKEVKYEAFQTQVDDQVQAVRADSAKAIEALEQQLVSLSEANRSLSEELARVGEQKAMEEEGHAALVAQKDEVIATLKTKMEELMTAYKRLKAGVQELQERLTQQTEANAALQASSNELESQNSTSIEELTALKLELAASRENASLLTEKLHEAEAASTEAESQRENQVDSFKKRVLAYEDELAQLKRQGDVALYEQKEAMQASFSAREVEAQQQLTELETSLAKESASAAEKEQEAQRMTKRLRQIEEQQAEAESDREEAQRRQEAATQEVEAELVAANETIQKLRSATTANVDQQRETLANLENEVAKLKIQVESEAEAAIAARAALETYKKRAHTALKKATSDGKLNLKRAAQGTAKLEQEVVAAKGRVRILEAEMEETHRQMTELKDAEESRVQSARATLEAEKLAQEAAVQAAMAALKAEVARLEAEKTSFEEQIAQLMKLNEGLERQVDELKDEAQRQSERDQQTIETKEGEVQELSKQLQAALAAAASLAESHGLASNGAGRRSYSPASSPTEKERRSLSTASSSRSMEGEGNNSFLHQATMEQHEHMAAAVADSCPIPLASKAANDVDLAQQTKYLKNVVMKYIASQVPSEKEQLVPVIAMLLHFSPQEQQQVVSAHSKANEEAAGLFGGVFSLFGGGGTSSPQPKPLATPQHFQPTTSAAKANSSGAALGSKDKNGVLTFGNDPSDDDDDEFATPLNPFAQ